MEQSQYARPSEAHWRQDAEWAIEYLTGTRHIDAGTIVLDGTGLGANLALEVGRRASRAGGSGRGFAASRSDGRDLQRCACADGSGALAGARSLRSGRGGRSAARAAAVVRAIRMANRRNAKIRRLTKESRRRKMIVWLNPAGDMYKQTEDALARWLDGLTGCTAR